MPPQEENIIKTKQTNTKKGWIIFSLIYWIFVLFVTLVSGLDFKSLFFFLIGVLFYGVIWIIFLAIRWVIKKIGLVSFLKNLSEKLKIKRGAFSKQYTYDNQNINNEKYSKTKKVTLLPLKIIILILLFLVMLTPDFKNLVTSIPYSFSECGSRYLDLPIPNNLKDSKIIFEQPIYYDNQIALSNSSKCLSIEPLNAKQIFPLSNQIKKVYNNRTWTYTEIIPGKSTEIASGTKFFISKRIFIKCKAINNCTGDPMPILPIFSRMLGVGMKILVGAESSSRSRAEILLLEDVSGKEFMIQTSDLNSTIKAGYYKNNERLGDVVFNNIVSDYTFEEVIKNDRNLKWNK